VCVCVCVCVCVFVWMWMCVWVGPIYVVKSHDSIDALATRFHTTEDQIMEVL
jgi:hypothetical protein